MKGKIKVLGIILLCAASIMLFACENTGRVEKWLSPMLSVSLDNNKLGVYEDFDLAKLNNEAQTPTMLAESSAVTKATLQLAYNGEDEYKVRINVRVDAIESEEDGTIGHNIIQYAVPKSHLTVIYFAQEAWYDGAYGANAASNGDTLFDERYCDADDACFSTTRRAIALNKTTAQSLSSIEFYVVGGISGHYVVNFFIEKADIHGHFHGINKLAIASTIITVESN